MNLIDGEENLEYLKKLTHLETIYIADNPITKSIEGIEARLKEVVPTLKQIDGNYMNAGFNYIVTKPVLKPITKQEIDPKAKELLNEVINK
jgi:hypothetical protein